VHSYHEHQTIDQYYSLIQTGEIILYYMVPDLMSCVVIQFKHTSII